MVRIKGGLFSCSASSRTWGTYLSSTMRKSCDLGRSVRYRPAERLSDEERREIRRVRDEVYQLLRKDDDRRRRGEGMFATRARSWRWGGAPSSRAEREFSQHLPYQQLLSSYNTPTTASIAATNSKKQDQQKGIGICKDKEGQSTYQYYAST